MSVLGGSSSVLGSVDLLSVARRARVPGIGLSASSRGYINQFLGKSASIGNALFSAGVAGDIATLQQQILALRASVPQDQLASNLAFSDSDLGNNVDTSA